MLPRSAVKCLLPVVSITSVKVLRTPFTYVSPPLKPQAIVPLLEQLHVPTPFLDAEKLDEYSCGTGQPAQRGRRKPLVWKRRKPWFDHQWSLDLNRVTKGPQTPYFPDGVPFTQIRSFQAFSGRSWKINAGRRRKIRLSLKRGRRKLL